MDLCFELAAVPGCAIVQQAGDFVELDFGAGGEIVVILILLKDNGSAHNRADSHFNRRESLVLGDIQFLIHPSR